MTAKVLTTAGRTSIAQALAARSFLAALSKGEAAWDGTWDGDNPPSPAVDVTDILDLVGYARPTIVDFVEPDTEGTVTTDEGGTYSLSENPTRHLRVRVSIPPDAFGQVTIREIGVFIDPTLAEGVPAGRTVMEVGDVTAAGTLLLPVWTRPQFLDAGTSYARNVILRL